MEKPFINRRFHKFPGEYQWYFPESEGNTHSLQTVCFGSWQQGSWPTCIWASNKHLSVSVGSWRSCHQRNPNTQALALLSGKVQGLLHTTLPTICGMSTVAHESHPLVLQTLTEHLRCVPCDTGLERWRIACAWPKGAPNLWWGRAVKAVPWQKEADYGARVAESLFQSGDTRKCSH